MNDTPQNRLLALLRAPETRAALHALAHGAAPGTPISHHLTLSSPAERERRAGHPLNPAAPWLACLPAQAPWWVLAQPRHNTWRLGIGHAFEVHSNGPARFASLDHAYANLCRTWRYQTDIGEANRPPLPEAFAGFAFDPAQNGPLPNTLLAIPVLLLRANGPRLSLTITCPANRIDTTLRDAQDWLTGNRALPWPTIQSPRPEPLADQAWQARVTAALRDIDAGRLAKVVLSRTRTLQAAHTIPPAPLLHRLMLQQPDATIYGHGQGTLAFVGATPERLVRLREHCIAIDALAGTAWPGSLDLANDKNRHEQALVARAIADNLAEFCVSQPDVSSAALHQAGQLAHWRSRITCQARPGTRLLELVAQLHPTPAVGGFPHAEALAWLTAHGDLRHAWYSGAIGLLTANGEGEFSVALRCALLDGKQAILQAGAGIVAGSQPADELAETEAKLGTLLNALRPDCGESARQA